MKRIIWISALLLSGALLWEGCSALDDEMEDLRAELGSLRDKVTALEDSKIHGIEQRIDSAKTTLALLQESDEVQTKDLSALQNEVDGISDDIALARKSISGLGEDAEELSGKIDGIVARLDAMEADIDALLSGISALAAKVRSVDSSVTLTYIQQYDDKTERVHFSRDTLDIIPKAFTLKFSVQPSSAAASLAKDSLSLISVRALYTLTKAEAGKNVRLDIIGASAQDGILTLTVAPDRLGKDFILGNLAASVAVFGSFNSAPIATEYINITPVLSEKALITYLLNTFDTDGDGQLNDMDKATSINLSGYGLTTVDDMLCHLPALKKLDCSNNKLTSINLSHSPQLTELNVSKNSLTSLDVTGNTALKSLVAFSNTDLTSLDLSKNTALTSLNISADNFTSLDVSNNTALTFLEISATSITSLDLSKNTALSSIVLSSVMEKLDISNTALKTVDLSKCKSLTSLNASNSKLTSLNTASNTALDVLNLSKCTALAISLDLSKNTVIRTVNVSNSGITALDLTNCTGLAWVDVSGAASLSSIIKISKIVKLIVSEGLKSSIYQKGQYISINNTVGIVSQTSSPMAVSVRETEGKWSAANNWCRNYGSGWRLPTADELVTVWKNRKIISSTLSALGGIDFGKHKYWTSNLVYVSEDDPERHNRYTVVDWDVYRQENLGADDAYYTNYARAVRSL